MFDVGILWFYYATFDLMFQAVPLNIVMAL